MIHTDDRFSKAVETRVSALEQTTDAEVVVVAADHSGSYRDVARGVASGIPALVVFVGIVALPWSVHPVLAVIDLIVVWGLVAWWTEGAPWVARLASVTRREHQVRRSAAAEFHLEAVHATPRRTGLLIYVSAWEGRVELVPDVGLEARIPRGLWAEAASRFAHDDLDSFLSGLDAVGALLAEHVPPLSHDEIDLANAPRIR